MQKEWWYSIDGKKTGPHSHDEMVGLIGRGALNRRHLVWKQGFENWVPLAEVDALSSALAAIPPEIPTPTERDLNIALPLAGAWRRFFARLIDLWAISLPAAFLVSIIGSTFSTEFALWVQEPGSQYVFGWLILPLVLLIEAMIFGLFGSTLGKALLGVKVMTTTAIPARFAQYARRLVGVYWYGLGTGFPLVSLFTMARQHGRLKMGKFATYDEGVFNIKARKLGLFRAAFAVATIIALFSINVALQAISQEADRAYYAGFDWTNSSSGRTVQIPSGWVHESSENVDSQPIDIFSGPQIGVFVILAEEEIDPSMSLKEYAQLWLAATEESMTLSVSGQPPLVRGLPALRLVGMMADDSTQRIDAVIVHNGDHVWRVLLVGTSGEDPATDEAVALRNVLFGSI